MQAIKNAKRSAIDLARSVNLVAGKPIEISEEKIKEEWGDTNESHIGYNTLFPAISLQGYSGYRATYA